MWVRAPPGSIVLLLELYQTKGLFLFGPNNHNSIYGSVAQSAEAMDLKSIQFGFKSQGS